MVNVGRLGIPGGAGVPPAEPPLGARRALILAFSQGLQGHVWLSGSAGVLARNAALARGDTLTLALSHEGRGDPLAAICT